MTSDLRDRIAAALEAADYRPGMRRGDLADAVLPVVEAEQAEYDETVVGQLNERIIRLEKRASRAEAERDRLAALAREFLGGYWEHGHPGYAAVRTRWLPESTLGQWRQVLADGSNASAPGARAEATVADLFFCPTAGEVESASHGGFDVCCDRPDLHLPMPDSPATAAVSAALSEAAKAALRVARVREYCEALAGGSCRVQAAVTARDVLGLLDGKTPAAGGGADGEQR